METIIESKFDFGRVVATTTLANYCEKKGFSMLPYLIRHANGDWGDVCKEDWKSNDEALKNGESRYLNTNSQMIEGFG